MDVLVERPGGREGQMAGRSPYMQAVNFLGSENQIGKIVSCVITQAKQKSVSGELDDLKGAA